MADFVFTARDGDGKLVKNLVSADSDLSAARLLSEKGLFPISIKPASQAGFLSSINIFKRVPAKQKVLFARQLATMVNSGLPIAQSLTTLQGLISNKILKEVIGRLVADVEGGMPLSQAFAAHPDIFNQTFVSLVASGEISGNLDKVLARIANQMEKDYNLASKLRSAAVYPTFVIVFVIGIMITMTIFVLPKFAEFYTSFGASLPGPTQVLLNFSHALTSYWYIFVLIVVFGSIFLRRWLRTPAGKAVIDPLKLKVPALNVLITDIYMARFTRTLGTLVGSGVPILDSLAIVADSIGNTVYRQATFEIAAEAKRGTAISVAIVDAKIFPNIVAQMVTVGEQTGELDNSLLKLADYYDEEIDNITKNLSSVVEPLLIIIVGFLVFLFIIVLLLPIYGIVFKLSGSNTGFVGG